MIDREPIDFVEQTARGARLQALTRYWRQKRGDRKMPLRADIDPIEIPRLLPIVLIADVISGAAWMRLLGSEATSALGRETRGLAVGEVALGEFAPVWRQAFAAVIRNGEPTEAGGAFTSAYAFSRVDLALMPLTAGSGAIDQIFGGLIIQPVLHEAAGSHNVPITYIRENPHHPHPLDDAGSGRARDGRSE